MIGKREGHPCCGLHSSKGKREVQGAPPVAGYIQGVGGVGGRTGYLLLPVGTGWADILECISWRWNEGGRRSENPLLQATLVSEVLEAEQPSSTGRQEVQGTPTSKAISELQWWECTGNCRE
ncbi:hypothetical protein DFH08DRAFT_810604 [Mycena albidolilacea]|uniref:Uncharacterized protein n=1 Tax=Mycena albidolilacea TaxID=1033008 RepID=A0AAD6ZZK7_9AGAR|nr:hypothetical protein DFH08DRAFT_810604 [Mycena albidolilacea]